MDHISEKKSKKRKRSDSWSSDQSRSRSRSRSRSERKKSKKSKKKHSKSKSKRDEKRKRSKSNKKSSKKKDRKRSESRTHSSNSKQDYQYPSNMPPMGVPPGYMFYPPTMIPPRMRPPFYDQYMDSYKAPAKPAPPKTDSTTELPTDKIVKDQNFLNSDEKLFDSIINNEMHHRNVFEDAQISENLLGSTLYKSVKKFVYDPNTMIFESNEKPETYVPKTTEVLKYVIDDLLHKTQLINLGDMKSIREQLYNYKNRLKTEEINNI
jgi:hypothetical protein